ncbi:hypothetical protein DBR06_SOUSAS2810115, partial [Sousa chinensis]
REFQWVSQLPMSGMLDAATLRQMTQPRCGVADTDSQVAWTKRVSALFTGRRAKMRRKKRFARQGNKWYKRHLSYRLVNWPQHLPEPAVRGAVRAAFQLWSNVSALEFWEAPATGPADIRLTFFQGDHNDGLSNAFDGPGGALAHAFLPRRGEAHFDRDERWSLSRRRGLNLFVVLAHEIGHTLGLTHSAAPRALMAPYYKRLGRDALLSWDDVLAVQSLYGEPPARSPLRSPLSPAPRDPQGSDTGFSNRIPHPKRRKLASPSQVLPDTEASGSPQILRNLISCCASPACLASIIPTNSWAQPSSAFQLLIPARPGLRNSSHIPAPSSRPRKPQGGSGAIQLPGKLFTDFEAWDPHRLQGRRPETRGPKYCHSSFDAITVGSRCWRFQGPKPVWGSPQLCRAGGLPPHPDAALYFPPLSRLILFKGARYYVLARGGLQVEPYYPRGLQDWGGVPEEVSGALPRPDGSIIFFRDDRYWRLDQAKLRATPSGRWATELAWMGCWHANSGGTLF